MKHHLLFIIIVVSSVFLTCCMSTKYILVDIMYPAKVSFPQDIVNIGIVDNAGLIFSDSILRTSFADDTISKDRIVNFSKEILKYKLTRIIKEEDFFNEVRLYLSSIRTDKDYGEQHLLEKDDIQSLANKMEVDAIITLDVFDIDISQKDSYSKTVVQIKSTHKTARENVVFNIYKKDGTLLAPTITYNNAVNWEVEKNNDESYIPYAKLSSLVAQNIAQQLIPYWRTQERRYYNDDSKPMKEAHKQVEEGHWTEAGKLWKEIFDKLKEGEKKALVAANIALSYENMNDIANAYKWILTANTFIKEKEYNTEKYDYIQFYKEQLHKRMQNNPTLLNQLGATSDTTDAVPIVNKNH